MPASLLARLAEENTALSRVFTLPTSTVGQLQLEVEDYCHAEGRLSMAGGVRGARHSSYPR